MGSQYVTWMLPYMVLDFASLYAVILAVGAIYHLVKYKDFGTLVRDAIFIGIVLGSAQYGIKTGHSVIGLVGMGIGCCMSLLVNSNELSKTQDMAPSGHIAAFNIITALLILSGILTSEL